MREVDAWRSDTLAPNPNAQLAGSSQSQTSPQKLQIAKTAAQISVLQERKQKLEIERLVLQKELVHRQEYEAKTIKNNTSIRIGLVRAAKSLRQHLADEDDPHKIEKMLVTAFRNLCDRINGPDDRGTGDG